MDRVLIRLAAVVLGAAVVAAPALAADDPVAHGADLFDMNCSACHSVAPALKNKLGPSLFGVVGRKAGAVEGYAYSPALAEGALNWTPETLDAYLTDPQAAAPGNRMKYDTRGLKPDDRAALIAFLGAQK